MTSSAAGRYRVSIRDSICGELVDATPARYISPPHTEVDARRFISVLGVDAVGHGPWQHPISGGQRTITLQRDR